VVFLIFLGNSLTLWQWGIWKCCYIEPILTEPKNRNTSYCSPSCLASTVQITIFYQFQKVLALFEHTLNYWVSELLPSPHILKEQRGFETRSVLRFKIIVLQMRLARQTQLCSCLFTRQVDINSFSQEMCSFSLWKYGHVQKHNAEHSTWVSLISSWWMINYWSTFDVSEIFDR
jgi:hypothetical protein